MCAKKLHRLMLTLSASGLLMASSCQLIVDPLAAVGVANALSRCDFEFDDGHLDEIECDSHRDDDFFWRPWWF